MALLRSVRGKLVALVGLTALAALLAVAILSWIMRQQLLEQVDLRVPQAARGFERELGDDVRDLESAARHLAARGNVERALEARDGLAITALGAVAFRSHPELDLCFFDARGALIANLGLENPLRHAAAVPELAALPERFAGVLEHGCEDVSRRGPPGYAVARRVGAHGLILACLPLDRAFLRNARSKLGVELALVEPGSGARRPTGKLPRERIAEIGGEVTLLEEADRLWAAVRFAPRYLRGPKGQYAVVAALDVTGVRDVLQKNLLLAVGVLSAAALAALLFGLRIARTMVRAVGRLREAFRRLVEHEYVYVDPLRTHDELEELAHGFNRMVDGLKERDKLRATLGKYMTRRVMEHLLQGRLQLGGETLRVTILFCDIRGFTAISERMDAQTLVRLLNEYFTAMVTILLEEDGVVDKYIGDAVMAVFGAPVPQPDDAVRAVRAAVRMRDELGRVNRALAAGGLPELAIGIGVHTGEVVAGNIGSDARMEYTVIGDAVNLASRLESSTKELRADVVISGETYAEVEDAVEARFVREITVKGRAQPVLVYEVLGLRE